MNDKPHLLRFGYAPGEYGHGKCTDCEQKFYGDKYARRCETCAETLYSQVSSVEAVADKHRAMTTLPEEAVKAADIIQVITDLRLAILQDDDEGLAEHAEPMVKAKELIAKLSALPFLPVQGAVKADAIKLIERMAFGYEVMFEKLCHISGTSGADQSWYRAKAREATERLSPLHSITTESNKSVSGDCKRQYQDFMARILSALEPSAVQSDELLFRRKDIQRGLILFRTSNNAHDAINFVALTSKIDALSSEDKDELAGLMRSYADSISSRKSPPEPSAARELALEEAARVCDAKIVSMQAHYDQADNPFIRSNLAGDIALTSHLAAAIRVLSSPDHADAVKVEGEGWMPIESAPKDGAPVLAYQAGRYFKCWLECDRYEGGYFWQDEEDSEPSPTHWRPLPSAPASEGGSNV